MAVNVMVNAEHHLRVALAEKEVNLLAIIRYAKSCNLDVRYVDGYKITKQDIAKVRRALIQLGVQP